MADASASSGNGGWMAAAMSGLVSGAQAVSKGGPKRQYKYNKKLAEDQNVMNRANAEWVLNQNQRLLDEQRIYDSPEQQMARYKAAGLNPHLIYGQASGGSSPIQMGSMPSADMGSVNASYPDLAGGFINAARGMQDMGYTAARTDESLMRTQSMSLQNEIARTNPMLKPEVADSVAKSMEQAAKLKADESFYIRTGWTDQDRDHSERIYVAKVRGEVEKMFNSLKLNTADLSIKNKILESKEFENQVKEIQAKWLKDGEVSPEHIRQGLMLILSKMMN